MAFKLKSPFNVTTVGQTLNKPTSVKRETGVSGMQQGLTVPMAEGDQEVKIETNPKEQAEEAYKKAEKGMPLGLNPKQQARFEVRKYRKGLKDDARFDRQAEKAKKIYKRNEFEKVNDKYLNPEEAEAKKLENQKKLEDAQIALKEYDIDQAAPKMLDMEKPNRAGGPVKMLKSIEDNTPAKYKSVRKLAKEELMSSLAKKGQPYE